MNCPECGSKMRLLKLPHFCKYKEVSKRKLWVCISCGYEKEYVGGGKLR